MHEPWQSEKSKNACDNPLIMFPYLDGYALLLKKALNQQNKHTFKLEKVFCTAFLQNDDSPNLISM